MGRDANSKRIVIRLLKRKLRIYSQQIERNSQEYNLGTWEVARTILPLISVTTPVE